MAYLNLDLDYFNHPKTRRLVGLLGRGAEVLPLRLWSYCGKFHCEDGKLSGYSAQEVEAICAWWGKEGECVEALIRVKLLDQIEGEYHVHDWDEHQGHIHNLKTRAKNAAMARWGKRAKEPPEQCPKDATSNAQASCKQSPNMERQGMEWFCPEGGTGEKPKAKGLPSNEKEAIAWADMEMVPAEFAKDVFNQCEGIGWIDGQQRPITNWRSYIKSRYSRQLKAPNAPLNGGSSQPSQWKISTAIEAKEERIKFLRHVHAREEAGVYRWPKEKQTEKEECLRLVAEVEDLRNQLVNYKP